MDIDDALNELRRLRVFMSGKYPPSTRRDEVCLALETVVAEVARLREVVAPPKRAVACGRCLGGGKIPEPSLRGYIDCPACNGRG